MHKPLKSVKINYEPQNRLNTFIQYPKKSISETDVFLRTDDSLVSSAYNISFGFTDFT